eukprot:1535472-Prymnesium_polylepis.1
MQRSQPSSGQAALEESGAERAGMATVSGRSSGEGSQRSSDPVDAGCERAGLPWVEQVPGRGLRVLCAGRRWALFQVVRRADLQLDVLRRQHDRVLQCFLVRVVGLSLIHISEPTRRS